MVPDWQQCDSAWLRSPSGREILLPLPSGSGQFAAIAPRLHLDNALVVLARSRGINILENISFESVLRNDNDCVEIQTSGGAMTADFVVAADGMWSPVRRALGLSTPSYLGEWHAFRQYFGNVTGPASTQLCVWFEPDLLPGYAWSFPLPGL
jgi:2-polyprenyl-6-methoxyphenol hydroxylase-like FAD-dependent oxidoreductase